MKSLIRTPSSLLWVRAALLAGMVTCIVGVGCKTRAQRDAEEAEQKQKQLVADTKAQEQQTIATGNTPSIQQLKAELRDRIEMYSALAGEYSGTYVANENAIAKINVSVSVSGAPSAPEMDKLVRENDLLRKLDEVALEVQIKENLASNSRFSAFCPSQNIKADFSMGKLRIDCSAQGLTTARRIYDLSFASGDLDSMPHETPDQARARSAEIANNLVAGRRAPLGGFRLSIILNPEFGSQFTGFMKRVR